LTKVKNPLLSFKAHGSLADAITLQDRGSGTMARRKPLPTDPRTLPQVYQRWLYEDYAELWHTLTPAEQDAWNRLARRKKITGFNFYMSTQLRTLPDITAGWHLDKIVGTSAIDFSKNLNYGTVFGASLVDGIIDAALDFDGVDNKIKVPHSTTLNMQTDFTWEAFVTLRTLATHATFIDKYAWMASGWLINISATDNRLYFITMKPAGLNQTISSIINIFNTPMHLAVVKSGATATIYLNAQDVTTSHGNHAALTPNALDLYMGATRTLSQRLDGTLDEVRLYNRALAQTTILRHSLRRYPS